MPVYLVERYVPRAAGLHLTEIVAAAQAAAAQTVDSGTIRYLAATLVPGDELSYCLFEAASIQAVQQAHELAQIPCERIVAAFHATAPALPLEPAQE